MQVYVNGRQRELPDETSMAELVSLLDLQPRRIAVEQNKRLVRRADYDRAILAEGDSVEIVTLVGGG